MIKPHHVFLTIGFILSVLAYSNLCDIYTVEGYNLHSKLMATSYVLVLMAAWRMSNESLTRLFVNIFLGAAVANCMDEFFFDNTIKSWKEYVFFGTWAIISAILFLKKQRHPTWDKKRTSSPKT